MNDVLTHAGELQRSEDASKGTRARSQATATQPGQCSPNKQTASYASRVSARFQNNKMYDCYREFDQEQAQNERYSRREKESDKVYRRRNERRVSSSRPPRQEGDSHEEAQSCKPQDARQLQK